jgi:hypothetical protein
VQCRQQCSAGNSAVQATVQCRQQRSAGRSVVQKELFVKKSVCEYFYIYHKSFSAKYFQ